MRLSKYKGLPAALGWQGAISCLQCKLIASQWYQWFGNRKAQQVSAKLKLHQWLNQVMLLTSTPDTCIFKVCTIMNSYSIVGAVHQSGLSTPAGNIVQKDGSSALTKLCKWNSRCSCGRKVINQYHFLYIMVYLGWPSYWGIPKQHLG